MAEYRRAPRRNNMVVGNFNDEDDEGYSMEFVNDALKEEYL